MEGFQLWLNLAGKDKMRAPWYRDIQSAEIPEFTTAEGVKVRVIAGASHGVAGAMQREMTEPLYLDLDVARGSTFEQTLPSAHNAFVYVYPRRRCRSARRRCRRSGWRFCATTRTATAWCCAPTRPRARC